MSKAKIKVKLEENKVKALESYINNRDKVNDISAKYRKDLKVQMDKKDALVKVGVNDNQEEIIRINQKIEKLTADYKKNASACRSEMASAIKSLTTKLDKDGKEVDLTADIYASYLAKMHAKDKKAKMFTFETATNKEITVTLNGKSYATNVKNWLVWLGIRGLDGDNVGLSANYLENKIGVKVVRKGNHFITSVSANDFKTLLINAFLEYIVNFAGVLNIYNGLLVTDEEKADIIKRELSAEKEETKKTASRNKKTADKVA